MTLECGLTKYGGQKFLVTIGCGFVNTGLLLHHNITQDVYSTIIVATVGAFIFGNVTESVMNTRSNNSGPT